jgi:hypothetical protein
VTTRTFTRKNKQGLTLDDLRQLVKYAEGMSAYTPVMGKVRMSGRIVELTVSEDEAETS